MGTFTSDVIISLISSQMYLLYFYCISLYQFYSIQYCASTAWSNWEILRPIQLIILKEDIIHIHEKYVHSERNDLL